VVTITDYGAFVELEPGVEGLVHVSEMSWSKRAKHPSKVVSVGDAIEVVVLDVKPEERRISLGLKQTEPDPWALLAQKYPVGSVIKGRVRNLTDFGAFVEVEDGIDGLIHISDMSWTKRLKHPSELLKKGDVIEAKVLQIDVPNRRLSLGLKQLHDIWENWFARNKVGDVVKGKVVRVTSFGAFIELEEGIEGLCHISEVNPSSRGQRGERPEKIDLEVGQEYEFKIIKLNQNEHKIGLSYRAALNEAERKTIQQYRSSKSSSRATIGDMILSKRGGPLT
jgi:small subunit ribosomal protein S1